MPSPLTITTKTILDGSSSPITVENFADSNNGGANGAVVAIAAGDGSGLVGSTNPLPVLLAANGTGVPQTADDAAAISWKSSGGTYALTATSVANGAGRQGAKGDLGTPRKRRFSAIVTNSIGAAAVAGTTLDFYWASSPSPTAGTSNPGNTTGADAAYAPSDYLPQLQYIGSLVLSNAAGTGIQTTTLGPFTPRFRYGMPVIVNNSGQALGATATDHTFTLNPLNDVG